MVVVVLGLLIFIILVVALVWWQTAAGTQGGLEPPPSRQRGVLSGMWDAVWQALHPDFGGFDTDRATTQTLNLLVAAMLIFGAVAVMWCRRNAYGMAIFRTA
jgi:hypothetical protein